MKYCSIPYEYLYLDNEEGDIYLCPWMIPGKACIGNLVKSDIDTCYNSKFANELRSSIEDQSFRFCRNEACPHLQNNDLPEITEQEYECRKKEKYHPIWINMAHDFVCNQHCETCRKTVYSPPKSYEQKMNIIQKKIVPYLNTATRISASGHGDPFASKHMMELLSNMHPSNPDLTIMLETNGVFFDENHWERIQHLKNFNLEVTVTSNSFDEFIYRYISRGGNYDKLMHSLSFMSELRKKNDIKQLTHCLVIQDRNFREIPKFIERSFRDYNFDFIILRPVYQWGTMDDDVYWFKDVLNPAHPYHKEYLEIIKDPILQDPRVYNFGGDSVHEYRAYPGAGADSLQKMRELEQCICEKDLYIEEQQRRISELELNNPMFTCDSESILNDQERRIRELQSRVNIELRDLEKQLSDIRNSSSYRIGRAATYIPRKLRDGKAR